MRRSRSLWSRWSRWSLSSAALLLCALSCERQPDKDYEDFKRRAESLRAPPRDEVSVSRLADLRGMWLLRASLSAGIDLGLRIRLFVVDEGGAEVAWPRDEAGALTPTPLEAEIWLDRQDPRVDEPIVRVSRTASVDAEGRFTLLADPLSLDPATLNLTTAVESVVYLHSETRSADSFCGRATGSVTVPLVIDLEGSTFFAARDDSFSLQLAELPSRCPDEGGAEGGA
ncbi:MAG: hypothetical protein FJ138_13540, partial [Deltaproteobacteria bacterium]|nr:hypothetical protein [Deltaproteobacteria bacterium]